MPTSYIPTQSPTKIRALPTRAPHHHAIFASPPHYNHRKKPESPDESPAKIVTGDSPFRPIPIACNPFARPSGSANHHHREQSPVSVDNTPC